MKKIIALTLISLMGLSAYAMEEETITKVDAPKIAAGEGVITKTVPKTIAVVDCKQWLPGTMLELFELYAKHADKNAKEFVNAVSEISLETLKDWAFPIGGKNILPQLENDGITLLHIFVDTPNPDLKIIEFLLHHGQAVEQKDYYEVLGVSKDAKEAKEKFQEIAEAYRILSQKSPYQIALERNNKEVVNLFVKYSVMPLIEQCLKGEKEIDELVKHWDAFKDSRDIEAVKKIYFKIYRQLKERYEEENAAMERKKNNDNKICSNFLYFKNTTTRCIEWESTSGACSDLLNEVTKGIKDLNYQLRENNIQTNDSEVYTTLFTQLTKLRKAIEECQEGDYETGKETVSNQLNMLQTTIENCVKNVDEIYKKHTNEASDLFNQETENLKTRYDRIFSQWNALYEEDIDQALSRICFCCESKSEGSLEVFKEFLEAKKPNVDRVKCISGSEPEIVTDNIIALRITIGKYLEDQFDYICKVHRNSTKEEKDTIEQMLYLANQYRDNKFSGASIARHRALQITPQKTETYEDICQLILHCATNKARHKELERYLQKYCEISRSQKSSNKSKSSKPLEICDLKEIQCTKDLYGNTIDMSLEEYLNTFDKKDTPCISWLKDKLALVQKYLVYLNNEKSFDPIQFRYWVKDNN